MSKNNITPLPNSETPIISEDIAKLLSKRVFIESYSESEGYISGVFTRNKKDRNKRIILNLKKIDKFMNYKYFKIDSITGAINLLRSNA